MSNSTTYLIHKQKAFITVKYVEMTYICCNLCYDINLILHADIYNCLKTSVLLVSSLFLLNRCQRFSVVKHIHSICNNCDDTIFF